jgi:hypothetical protein
VAGGSVAGAREKGVGGPGWSALESATAALRPLEASVEALAGSSSGGGGRKPSLMAEESLTKHLLRLDAIQAGADAQLRAARKAQVLRTQALLERVETLREPG